MLTTVFRQWSVSLCPRCEATFYDETVLETLLRQPDLRLSYLRPALLPNLACPHPPEDDRNRIDCPICQAEMTREGYSSSNPMLVDRCPAGHGIWLDDGELGNLVSEWENSHQHVEPGFWEGLRRLLGRPPKSVIDEQALDK
jgi:Zn-finger nucleic acid-binding protein